MFEAHWNEKNGWGKSKIVPYHSFQIDPFNTALHYAIECFEGMKAFIDDKGKIRLFRPEMNAERLRTSCERISLPVKLPYDYVLNESLIGL